MWAPRARACFTRVITLIVEYDAFTPQSTTRSAPTICSESLPVIWPTVTRQPAYAVETQIERSSRLAPRAWKSGWPAKYWTCPIEPAYENGRIASAPSAAVIARQRAAIVSIASSQDIGMNSPAPLGPTRRSRSEEHTSELQSLAYLVCRLLL